MNDSTKTRLAVAAPISLLASMLMVIALALFLGDSPLATPGVLILVPALCAVWLFAGWSWFEKSGMVLAVVGITAVTYVAALAGFLAVFERGGGYIHPDGWYGVWASLAVLLIGSLILRVRLSKPVLGPWLLWYVPVLAAVVWAAMPTPLSDPTDATLMSLAFRLASLGLCTWVGLLAARSIGRGLKWGLGSVT